MSFNVQVPRLHAIILDPEVVPASLRQATPEQIGAQRAATLQLLTSVCGGDSLAAEYLLLQLISKCVSILRNLPNFQLLLEPREIPKLQLLLQTKQILNLLLFYACYCK